MESLIETLGSTFGSAIDGLMSKSTFAVDLSTELQKIEQSIIDSTTEAFTVGKRSPFKKSFGNCDEPGSLVEGIQCAKKFTAVNDSSTATAAATTAAAATTTAAATTAATADSTTTEDEKQKIKELEAKTKDYIKKDTSLTWNGGDSSRMRHVRWANQVVEPSTSSGPISYKDAILAQPLPVLSPLRGTNQPQGIRAIADANAGYNPQRYDPKYTIQAAIPANISSGSLDYTQKATIAGSNNNATTADTSSTFMAKFM